MPALLSAAPALASNGGVNLSHQAYLLLHILGIILFAGNVIVSATWVAVARKTGDRAVLFCASRAVTRGDWLLSLPGLLLILVPGIMAVEAWGGFGRTSWAEMALAVFVLICVIWIFLLHRYRRRMLHLTREAAELRIGLSNEFGAVAKRWSIWNGIVTILLLYSLYLMVFKPHLWGSTV
jgi:uncharacterized membrane protein